MEDFNYDDIVPLELNDEEPQLCHILYSDEYKKVLGITLALLQKNEYSERALHMNTLAINLLASHYTLWSYRYDIIKELNKDLLEELDWSEEIALENQKNYQIWNYRQRILRLIEDYNPMREFPLLEAMLDLDPKNHHVWSYRKWLVEEYRLYNEPKEIGFVDKCIKEDVRNNSAWTHRYFLIFTNLLSDNDEIIDNELAYVKNQISISPQNASSWNYLRGMISKFNIEPSLLHEICDDYISESNVKCVEALELKAQLFELENRPEKANKIFDSLAEKYDPIRRKYWKYRASNLQRSD